MTAADALGIAAAGALLRWTVTVQLDWIDLHMTGTVLWVAGLVALAVSLLRQAPSDDDAEERERRLRWPMTRSRRHPG